MLNIDNLAIWILGLSVLRWIEKGVEWRAKSKVRLVGILFCKLGSLSLIKVVPEKCSEAGA